MKQVCGRNGRKILPKHVEQQEIYQTYDNDIFNFLFQTWLPGPCTQAAPAAVEQELKWTPAALAYFPSNQQMTALHSAACLALAWPGVTFGPTACPLQRVRLGQGIRGVRYSNISAAVSDGEDKSWLESIRPGENKKTRLN